MKAIVIGTSLSGKSTIIKKLRLMVKDHISEIDEELTLLNGGKFPSDDRYKNEVLTPKVISKVLNYGEIIFFTNVQYFKSNDLVAARKKGFKIIQLEVGKSELLRRNKKRVKEEGYEDASGWLDDMLAYQLSIKNNGLVDKIIRSDQETEDVAREIVEFLSL